MRASTSTHLELTLQSFNHNWCSAQGTGILMYIQLHRESPTCY